MRQQQDSSDQIIANFTAVSRDTLVGRMGVTVTAASAEQVTGSMPVDGNTQPYGLLHGGASCVLAETLGSLGAALTAGRAGSRSAWRSTRPTTGRRPVARSPGWPPGCTRAGPSPAMKS